MTDILNGKIDILGFEISPETTQAKFEAALGERFEKTCLDPEEENPSVYRFALNGKVGVSPEPFDSKKHIAFILNDMTFINVLVLFRDGRISWVRLVTEMDDYEVNDAGKIVYSDDKNLLRYNTMKSWSIKHFGEPVYITNSSFVWNCGWGSVRPSPQNYDGSSMFLIEYGREYIV